MKAAFLDTSGWFAAMSVKEAKHKPALAAYRAFIENGTQLVTTNLVVAEMHILISRYRGVADGLRFIDSLYQDASHDVVFVDREIERAAVDRWVRKFRDQQLSVADAVSFEVMRTRRIRSALTLDAHFAVVGFDLVP
ncbi:MAG: PIN domain-containing protein [Gemmatimonadaceae bacterium]